MQFKKQYHLLKAIAANLYFRFPGRKLKVIAVTGTDGKTTTSNMIFNILKDAGYKCTLISTLGYKDTDGNEYEGSLHTTTPSPFFIQKLLRKSVNKKDDYVILEVSSHGIDQHRIYGISPVLSIITNITPEHLDYHKTFENYVRTKAHLIELTKEDGIIVLNKDDKNFDTLKEYVKNRKLITFGIENTSDILAKDVGYEDNRLKFNIKWSRFTIPVKLKLIGEFNIYNALGAFASGLMLKVNGPIMIKALENFEPPAGRMNFIQNTPFTVIIDFAHTYKGLENALTTVRNLTKKNLIVVFGAAGERDHEKRPLMGKAANIADKVVITSEDPRTENPESIMSEIEEGLDEKKFKLEVNYWKIADRKDAINFAIKNLAEKDDLVIITGKGPEKSFSKNGVEYPWDEFKIVKDCLKQ